MAFLIVSRRIQLGFRFVCFWFLFQGNFFVDIYFFKWFFDYFFWLNISSVMFFYFLEWFTVFMIWVKFLFFVGWKISFGNMRIVIYKVCRGWKERGVQWFMRVRLGFFFVIRGFYVYSQVDKELFLDIFMFRELGSRRRYY